MSEEGETNKIWSKLDTLGRQYERLATILSGQSDVLNELRLDVKAMTVNGCAKAESHKDHDERIRSLENSRATATGAAAVLGAIAGWVAGLLGG